jgi:hypothetical protein
MGDKGQKIWGEVCETPRPYAAAADVVRCDVVRCCFSMMDTEKKILGVENNNM